MDPTAATIRQSVKTLLCLPKSKSEETQLVATDDRIELTIAAKKIPAMDRPHVGRIVLPHSLYNDDSNICMFVKDEGGRKNREFDVIKQKYLKQLEKAGIKEVKEVIPLTQLKIEFKPFEAKRRLSDAFDAFLGDERIFSLLRSLLGKHFHSRHRAPIAVRLHRGDLAKNVSKSLRTSLLNVTPRGPVSMVPCGNTTINSEDQIVENILAVWNQLDAEFPGGKKNVRSITIKTAHSASVPVYQDLDYSTEVPVPDLRDYEEEPEPEEIDTVSGAKVMVYPDGRVRLVRKEKKPKKEADEGSAGQSEEESSEDEVDDRVVRKLIDADEREEALRKRRLERRRAREENPESAKKKARRPLLEAHAKAEKVAKSEKH